MQIYNIKKRRKLFKMNDTVIYLIRHAETVEENGIRNTNENSQMINEKEILSIKGEEQSKKLSENTELQNLDVIWTKPSDAKEWALRMKEKGFSYNTINNHKRSLKASFYCPV